MVTVGDRGAMNADDMCAPKQFRTVYPLLAVLLGGMLVATVLLITQPAGAAANRHVRHSEDTSRLQMHGDHGAAVRQLLRHYVSHAKARQHNCPPSTSPPAPKPKPTKKSQPPAPQSSPPPPSAAPLPASHRPVPKPASSTRRQPSPAAAARTAQVAAPRRGPVSVHRAPAKQSSSTADRRRAAAATAAANVPARGPDPRPAARLVAADSDLQHAALDAVPPRALATAVAPQQAARSPAAGEGVQRAASETALPVQQPWLLAILAIAALAAVSAASAKVVVARRKRG